jgi:hypothetical protein
MSRTSYEDALDNSIGLVEKGLTIEECLLTYPEYAAQLLGPLQAARTLQNGRARLSIPAPTMRRDAFLGAVATQARADASTPSAAAVPPIVTPDKPPWAPLRRFALVPYALPAVLAMLILGGAAWGVSAATGNAGPGSWIAGDSTHDDKVDVRGTIAAIGPDSITVTTPDGDVTAAITGDTKFEGADDESALIGDFSVGDAIKLSATRTADGSLVARKLEHEEVDDEPDPVPTIAVAPTEPRDDVTEPGGQNDDDDLDGDDGDDGAGGGGDDDDGGDDDGAGGGDDDVGDGDNGGVAGGGDDDDGGVTGGGGDDDGDDDDGGGDDDDGGDDD